MLHNYGDRRAWNLCHLSVWMQGVERRPLYFGPVLKKLQSTEYGGRSSLDIMPQWKIKKGLQHDTFMSPSEDWFVRWHFWYVGVNSEKYSKHISADRRVGILKFAISMVYYELYVHFLPIIKPEIKQCGVILSLSCSNSSKTYGTETCYRISGQCQV
jgi:hypothetical protein